MRTLNIREPEFMNAGSRIVVKEVGEMKSIFFSTRTFIFDVLIPEELLEILQ